MISIDAIFKQIDFLPSFNQVSHKALELLTDRDSLIKDIADTIRFDPGLMANVLKLANTVSYARNKEIIDLSSAINTLGRNKMVQILLISSTSKYFKNITKGYEQIQGELWKHSISTAIIAEHLLYLEPGVDRAVVFTAGILHDIGKIILSIWLADLWNDISYLVKTQNMGFLEAEKKVLGFTHSQVSAAILQRWNFSNDVILAAKYHHDKKVHTNPVVRIVKLADYMSILMGYMTSEDNLLYGGYDKLMDHYKIQTKDMQLILNQCFEEIHKVIFDLAKLN
jgi:putative nucleotidyltransferase with HDIG domain